MQLKTLEDLRVESYFKGSSKKSCFVFVGTIVQILGVTTKNLEPEFSRIVAM